MNARDAFLRTCALDVAVRKPGNVSIHSAGHRMQAQQFLDSAQAAAGPLFAPGSGVGERIEGAVRASWAAAGCNTNLGIVLLCAPLAVAIERHGEATQAALEAVLSRLDLQDARAAYRGIARANPGGLGSAEAEDVHAEPGIGLRAGMALAADRDLIARQYRDGYADVLARLPPLVPADHPEAAVQAVYLDWLGTFPDSHIVRKHGTAVAQTVMAVAQTWRARAAAGEALDRAPEFAAWDEALKSRGINPGTTADLTVATLMLSFLRPGGTDRDNSLSAPAV